MGRRLCLLTVILWLGWAVPASAQLAGIQPVVEVGEQLLQTTITAVESVLQTLNQILELTPVDEFILGDDFHSSLDEMAIIFAEGSALVLDLNRLNSQIQVLFDLESAPADMRSLNLRLAEIRRVKHENTVFTLRVQTLIRTTISALTHLRRILEALQSLLGNMQANQNIAQIQLTQTELLAKIQMQSSTYYFNESLVRITDLLTIESLYRIQEQIMADHPAR
jgi:hypothetical protein